ncbi:hypothetical protein ECZC04_54780 [Escherichia coli]|nr:hypothetical protein ECZC04_54780 [Escherichia coli]
MSSQLVGDRIEYGLREFSWSGEQAERFNAITRAYYMNAAATQFPLPEDESAPDPAPLPGILLVLFSLEEKKPG